MKKIILSILICGLSISLYAQSTPKTEKIKKLLVLTGSGDRGADVAKQLLSYFKTISKDVDSSVWDAIAKEINTEDINNLAIPIYDKYYTEIEIDQIIAFYKTPIGKKILQNTPNIIKESSEAGQKWGKEIGEKVYRELKEKGYLKDE